MTIGTAHSTSPARVFISSTADDLAEVRRELEPFLREQGYEPVLFESAGSQPALDGPNSALRHATQCDICLLIIGSRYGSRGRSGAVSFTHAEYRAARDAGRPVFAFIHHDTLVKLDLWTKGKVEGWTDDDVDLFKFVREISEERTRFQYSTTAELKRAIQHQLVSFYGYLLREFGEVVMFRPTSSVQWLGLGDKYWRAAQFGQALTCYRAGTTVGEGLETALCYANLARCLRLTGRAEEALAICQRGMDLYPNMRALHTGYVYSLLQSGRMDEALAHATKCTNMFPDDLSSWSALRYVYTLNGDKGKIREIVATVLALRPNDEQLRRRVQDWEIFVDGGPSHPTEAESI